MPTWNADQYLRFADERTRPCHDLIGRISLSHPGRIIDLGCGPGNSTSALAGRWPGADLTGLDSSPEMIAAAKQSAPERAWIVGNISTWGANEPCDLVFSNAALQWVPDHSKAFPHLTAQVSPGGALAVQMPANFDAPAHRLMRELAGSVAWRNHFSGVVREWSVHEPGFYYDVLAPRARRLDIWKTEYLHQMDGPASIVEWYKGTGLRPFLDALVESDRPRFLADYLTLLTAAYPRQTDGRVLFPFLRLFIIAYF